MLPLGFSSVHKPAREETEKKHYKVLMGRSVHSWNVQREFPCFLKVQIDVSDLSNSVSEIMIKLWSCLACGKVPADVEEKEASETMTYKGALEQNWDEVLPPASLQSLLWEGTTVHDSGLCLRLQMSSNAIIQQLCSPLPLPFPLRSRKDLVSM